MSLRHSLMVAGFAVAIPLATLAGDPETKIRNASAAWDMAFNAGDVDSLMDRYHESAVSMVPGHPASVGREAIRRDFESFFSENAGQHTTSIDEIVVSGDLAVERARYSMDITPKSGSAIAERGKHIVVYRRNPDGTWQVLWEIWNEGQ